MVALLILNRINRITDMKRSEFTRVGPSSSRVLEKVFEQFAPARSSEIFVNSASSAPSDFECLHTMEANLQRHPTEREGKQSESAQAHDAANDSFRIG